jgi:hypothetical protein
MLFFQLAMKPKAQQKQGFESPTGYKKPLTFAEWSFAFWMILSIASKKVPQLERGVRIPYGLSKTTHICWVVFCFLDDFVDKQKDSNAAFNRGSNPLRAIKDHSHLLTGLLLFG